MDHWALKHCSLYGFKHDIYYKYVRLPAELNTLLLLFDDWWGQLLHRTAAKNIFPHNFVYPIVKSPFLSSSHLSLLSDVLRNSTGLRPRFVFIPLDTSLFWSKLLKLIKDWIKFSILFSLLILFPNLSKPFYQPWRLKCIENLLIKRRTCLSMSSCCK